MSMLRVFNIFNNRISSITESDNKKRTEQPRALLAFCGQKINSTNLAPLGADTVSFGAKKRNGDKYTSNDAERYLRKFNYGHDDSDAIIEKTTYASDKEMKTEIRSITRQLASQVHYEADGNLKRFISYMNKAMGPLKTKAGETSNREHPVINMKFRTKDPDSIREKSTQKGLRTKEEVKERITDIIGGRIVLGDGMEGGGELVIDKITQAVKDGKFKVIEAENHTPLDQKYKYVSQKKLSELTKASAKRFGSPARNVHTKNQTGYTAVHLLVEFPDGYKGEIQILGYDVLLFKEIEDITYKILQNKSVDEKYGEIKKIMEPLLPVSPDVDDPRNIERAKKREEFVNYIDACYKHQRTKAAMEKRRQRGIPEFLSLNEFKNTRKNKIHLDESMDFNNLYKIKNRADFEPNPKV